MSKILKNKLVYLKFDIPREYIEKQELTRRECLRILDKILKARFAPYFHREFDLDKNSKYFIAMYEFSLEDICHLCTKYYIHTTPAIMINKYNTVVTNFRISVDGRDYPLDKSFFSAIKNMCKS